ncbi:MAG: T9SS type A sorting domain-containing protein, partial [Candidatus Latescibacterota bacterium]
GEIPFGTLHCSGSAGDLTVRYTYRPSGEETLLTGSLTLKAEDIRPKPSAFALLQNSPNPFNPSTALRFELPRNSHVRLIIRNLAGQKVTVLHDGQMPAGYHSIRWDATGFPSGVYFYTLEAEGFVETKRVMLVK